MSDTPLRRDHVYKRKTFFVTVGAAGGRRMRWRYETSNGLAGDGITGSGLEAAYEAGRRAAEIAIDEGTGA